MRSNRPVKASRKPQPKIADFDWREWCEWIEGGKNLKRKASYSYEVLPCSIGNGSNPVILATFSDQHIGAWGTDYALFRDITAELKETPNLYIALLGDETETAIKMRSVLEVTNQVLQPETQELFLEAWLEEIKHKVAFATWSNHSVERQEQASGSSGVKRILSRRCAYFNGIGHADIKVGKQEYRIAASHVFRGKSLNDANFGPKRYIHTEGHDREVAMQGDLHRPAIAEWMEAGVKRTAITSGSLHTNSGYAKRYFSLTTHPVFPCIVLHPDSHNVVPFWSVKDAVRYVR